MCLPAGVTTGAAPRVAVVGGGITGLVAARTLQAAGARVRLHEAGPRLGGAIRGTRLTGLDVDVGAEALFTAFPEGPALVQELGLGDELVGARRDTTWLAIGDRLRPLPAGVVMGVPGRIRDVLAARVLSPTGLVRAAGDLVMPSTPIGRDPTVGELVRRRFGDQVADRLVDPLLGGIHAGSIDALSARSTAPQLLPAFRDGRSAFLALRRTLAGRPPATGPAFVTVRGGLARVVDALAADLDVVVDSPITALERIGRTFRLGASPGQTQEVDAVVLAVPARRAADLLADVAPAAVSPLSAIPTASVAVVVLHLPASAGDRLPDGTGLMVPSTAGRMVKAVTFLTRKWPHLAPADGGVLLRASVGRAGDDRVEAMSDEQVLAAVRRDLADLLGIEAAPLQSHVERWPRAMPQYVRGHGDRVAAVEAAVTEVTGLAVAGASFRGVGIPACIRDGRAAAHQVLHDLGLGVAAARPG